MFFEFCLSDLGFQFFAKKQKQKQPFFDRFWTYWRYWRIPSEILCIFDHLEVNVGLELSKIDLRVGAAGRRQTRKQQHPPLEGSFGGSREGSLEGSLVGSFEDSRFP